ncbi:hypothetical protein WQ54_13205 [Bacillus sp. SA1-12]|nr:hypothetical protein WQ54_13205 [Bacillus sp. SA1-12]
MSLSKEKIKQFNKEVRDFNDATSALFRIPIFFSHQGLFSLNTLRQRFIIRMFNEIKSVLLFPRTLANTDQFPNTTLENVRTMINSSYGLAAALLQPIPSPNQFEPYSPFLQIEPSMAFQRGLPLLLVIENTMQQAGGIWGGGGQLAPFTPVIWFSNEGEDPVDEFFNSVQWEEVLHNWAAKVRSGYFIQTGPKYKYSCDSDN